MMPSQPPTFAYPRYYRRTDGAVVAGVASGLAAHLRISVDKVRFALVIFSLLSGIGVVFYLGVWINSSAVNHHDPQPSNLSRPVTQALVVVAALGSSIIGFLFSDLSLQLAAATIIILIGAVITWIAYDRDGTKTSRYIAVAGAVLVLVGVIVAAYQWQQQAFFGSVLASVLITLVGVAILIVPLGLRMWRRYNAQQADNIRAEQRAVIASRLHDSVLQTLALIQKRSNDPNEVVRLARSQERELRQWLFDSVSTTDATIYAAVTRACGEVEDLFDVRITPVFVGEDHPLTERTQAGILAAREAMVNAAKHANVTTVDVYVETLDGLHIFVRDRGTGFDITTIPEDRHGVRDSLIARVERVGGEVHITSTCGENDNHGTEVEIIVNFNED